MLTAETKRKIDYLRDALVGKIPVPSQQIEQITLGLIYKFMSDIDEQNEELGGQSFFRRIQKIFLEKHNGSFSRRIRQSFPLFRRVGKDESQ